MTTTLLGARPADRATEPDLVTSIHRVLASSAMPLTPARIRAALPERWRRVGAGEFNRCLRDQAAAHTFTLFPKYRSQQDRYWDRSMPVHVAALIRQVLQDGPRTGTALRRALPAYAQALLDEVLRQQLAQGFVHRHPPLGKRGGDRLGLQRPDARAYCRSHLTAMFLALRQAGFDRSCVRVAVLELLHEEEWEDNVRENVATKPGL